jgi:ethanolamine utilization protein EutJ
LLKENLRLTIEQAAKVIRWVNDPEPPPLAEVPEGDLYVGVDLGTAYLTLAVLDQNLQPIAGEYQFAQVARDGLVVDYAGAVDLVKSMKARVEKRIGRELTHAASGYPPGVPQAEVRATANVVEAAGMLCESLVDEPTAANAVIEMQNGAIVDVGGGTTGIAIIENGEVVFTADEATGGTHLTLVIAGAKDIPFEDAEKLKVDTTRQKELFPVIRPVFEKVASIVARQIEGYSVPKIVMVGGTSAFYRADEVVAEYTGIPTWVPDNPFLVTPLGMAMHQKLGSEG